jgi:hypothetical protein
MRSPIEPPLRTWPHILARFLVLSALFHLIWEVVQLPLYTIWTTEPFRKQAFAVLHCTGGDILIAGLSVGSAWFVLGRHGWTETNLFRLWIATVLMGLAYTIFSEWLNVSVRGNWTYADKMPTLPFLGTGLSPLLQWLVVPTVAVWLTLGRAPWSNSIDETLANR